jgi:hypothetical protein
VYTFQKFAGVIRDSETLEKTKEYACCYAIIIRRRRKSIQNIYFIKFANVIYKCICFHQNKNISLNVLKFSDISAVLICMTKVFWNYVFVSKINNISKNDFFFTVCHVVE